MATTAIHPPADLAATVTQQRANTRCFRCARLYRADDLHWCSACDTLTCDGTATTFCNCMCKDIAVAMWPESIAYYQLWEQINLGHIRYEDVEAEILAWKDALAELGLAS